MERLREIISSAEDELKQRLLAVLEVQKSFEVEQYARFLTMQYWLTQDVQAEFYTMAGHRSLRNRKSLREFFVKFAEEEEPHYMIAGKDLEKLGLQPGDRPIDVVLWKTYFEKEVWNRPFIRLGATCILENISNKSNDEILTLVKNSPGINEDNTRFLILHMHGPALPHGEEVLEAIEAVELSDEEWKDLEFGAQIGKKIYLQLVNWIITGVQ